MRSSVRSSACAAKLPRAQMTRRPQAGELLLDNRPARRHLVGQRVAVLRRAALDDVKNVDVVASQADGLDDAGEKLAGRADERLALGVLIMSRRLADEYQVSRRVAGAEHHLPTTLVQAAGLAVPDGCRELRQLRAVG